MKIDTFNDLVRELGEVAVNDIAWAEGLALPTTAEDFATEVCFVVCNSGMRNTVARGIFERVMKALRAGASAHTAFGHKGKAGAIDTIWQDRARLYLTFLAAANIGKAYDFVLALPWIGEITVFHALKNLGVVDVAKPDVHLMRVAKLYDTTPQKLCEDLARQSGYRVATVDTLIWRACANGIFNSSTGAVRHG